MQHSMVQKKREDRLAEEANKHSYQPQVSAASKKYVVDNVRNRTEVHKRLYHTRYAGAKARTDEVGAPLV